MRDLRSFDVWHVFIFQQNFCKHIAHHNYVNYVLFRYQGEACCMSLKTTLFIRLCVVLMVARTFLYHLLLLSHVFMLLIHSCVKKLIDKSLDERHLAYVQNRFLVCCLVNVQNIARTAFYFLLECLRSCFFLLRP